MTTEVKLKNEQEVPMFEYNSAVQELIKITKAEKENLDQQIVIAKTRLAQIKQEQIRLQGEFNQWKMAEEQKFKNDLSKRHNQLIDQENKMNILHKDLQQRDSDFRIKEERMMHIENDRQKIGNDRVEVEKIRVNALNLMAEADRKISEAASLMSQANTRISQSTKLDEKNSIRNQELTVREDKLKFDLKNLEMERNHLVELREFVEPKIAEIKVIEEQTARDKKEIDDKHQDIINKTEENKIAIRALEDKSKNLDARERMIRSTEDEIKRKIAIAKSKEA